MKVVHIINGLYAGGAETALCRFLEATNGRDCDAVVVSLTDKGDLGSAIEALGVRVVALDLRPGMSSLPGLWRLGRCLQQLSPDLVQGWMYHGNLAALAACWGARLRVPVLWNIRHSMDDLPGERPLHRGLIALGRCLSSSVTGIVYNSSRSAQQHAKYGFATANSTVIPNGFDTVCFRPQPDIRRTIRQTWGFAEDVFVIGLFARFHPVKGHTLFLQAAALLAQRQPQVRFVLAGKGTNGANTLLAEWIRLAGLRDRVFLAGERRDMPEFLNGIDLVTLTSKAEAFPNVLGEAMACGIPCVTTDVGDAAWLVGNTGTVVPCGDAEAICRAWQEHLNLDVSQRLQLGAAARCRIKEHFSQETVVEKYLQLYRQLVRPLEES